MPAPTLSSFHERTAPHAAEGGLPGAPLVRAAPALDGGLLARRRDGLAAAKAAGTPSPPLAGASSARARGTAPPAVARGAAVGAARIVAAGPRAVPPRRRSARIAPAAALGLAAAFGAPELPQAAAQAVEPIRFARGASSAVVRGAVVRGERALYSVEARGGQRMSLRIAAVERNAAFQVYAPGAEVGTGDFGVEVAGEALPGAGEGDDATRWAGTLPRSGAYTIVVGGTRGNATYRLTVSIR